MDCITRVLACHRPWERCDVASDILFHAAIYERAEVERLLRIPLSKRTSEDNQYQLLGMRIANDLMTYSRVVLKDAL